MRRYRQTVVRCLDRVEACVIGCERGTSRLPLAFLDEDYLFVDLVCLNSVSDSSLFSRASGLRDRLSVLIESGEFV